MTILLRRRHRRMFLIIAVLLPMSFIAGIAARKPVAITNLGEKLHPSVGDFTMSQWERSDLFPKAIIRVRLLHETADPARLAIQLSLGKNFLKPDLLVYWAAAESRAQETIPNDAILLGPFNLTLPLPRDLTGKPGVFILYSLADQEIVNVSKTFTAP